MIVDRRTALTGTAAMLTNLALAGATSEPSDASIVAARHGLVFRWLNNAGFEIVLPSGAHLFVDPWLDSAAFNPLRVASLNRADYILLSHIHGDHAQDVGAIQKRFPNVRIFVGQLSAEPLVRSQNLETSKIYKVSDRQSFDFGEVRIEAFAGRHTESNRGNYMKWEENGEMSSASWGTLDLYQYLITLPTGLKFMVWAGTPSIDNSYALSGLRPDVAAVHISPKQDFALLGEILRNMGPKVVVPHHYDIWPQILKTRPDEIGQFPQEIQPISPDNVIEKMMPYVERRLHESEMSASFFIPRNHIWYRYTRRSRLPVQISETF